MITIDRSNEGKGHQYHFPTIDFKFQNRGHVTAFLWQFAIEVIHAEIDQTPVLDFRAVVNDPRPRNFGQNFTAGALLIQATNNGWSDASNCHIRLDEPILNLLFSDSARQYRGTLQSGETQDIFQFTTTAADAQQFQVVKAQFKDLPLDNYQKRQRRGLALSTANISWQCNNGQHDGKAEVQFQNQHGPIVLTAYAFEEPSSLATHPSGVLASDTTYGAIIDPSIGPYEKKYAISRKIPSGDVERFHIMVGSSMSCRLQVRFKFFIDQTTIVESNIFDVHIWNPRNAQLHLGYISDVEDAKEGYFYRAPPYELYRKRQIDTSIFPLTSRLGIDELQRQADIYPFRYIEKNFSDDGAQTYYRRGILHRKLHRYQEALADFARAMELKPEEDWYVYCHGQIHLLSGQPTAFEQDVQAAITNAQNALKRTPNDSRIAFNLALYYVALENSAEAKAHYIRLISQCVSADSLLAAIDDLDDLLTVQPDSSLGKLMLAFVEECLRHL